MKRWVLLTLLLYLLCLSVLTVPLFLLFHGKDTLSDLFAFYYTWFVPILVLVQGVLLLVPIDVIHERPIKRRNIVLSAVIGSIPLAALTLGFFGSIILMVWKEDALMGTDSWLFLPFIAVSWLVWGLVFYKCYSSKDQKALTSTIISWFLRGSILELLVVIPSHVISRHRHECCGPPLTLLGIATGLSIALMSFGPGLLFLFAQRIKAKEGKITE